MILLFKILLKNNYLTDVKMTLEELKWDIRWWESKRWFFNIAVVFFGILGVYNGTSEVDYLWTIGDMLGLFFWGVGANVLYSIGMLIELFDWYVLNNRINFKKFRDFFFITGLLLSCAWTFLSALIYFANVHV